VATDVLEADFDGDDAPQFFNPADGHGKVVNGQHLPPTAPLGA
jgi:hypothetical protein